MPLPKPRVDLVAKYKWILQAMKPAPLVLGSIVGAFKVHSQLVEADARMAGSDGGHLDFSGLWWIIAGAALSVLIGGAEAYVAFRECKKHSEKDSAIDLHGCCLVCRAAIVGEATALPCRLRMTVYGVTNRKKGQATELEQVISYATADPKLQGEPGNTLSAHCGIIGRVARTGDPFVASRVSMDTEQFKREMIAEWGFSSEQADGLNQTRWSWMAVPMLDHNRRPLGVVYLDSPEKDFFSDAVVAQVLAACEALQSFALRRYP